MTTKKLSQLTLEKQDEIFNELSTKALWHIKMLPQEAAYMLRKGGKAQMILSNKKV